MITPLFEWPPLPILFLHGFFRAIRNTGATQLFTPDLIVVATQLQNEGVGTKGIAFQKDTGFG